MKATGIVRRIDDLGRVVIPKEIRRTMSIRRGAQLEIFTANDGSVIFKKYSPLEEYSRTASGFADALSRLLGGAVAFSDTERVVAASSRARRELVDKLVSDEILNAMEGRAPVRERMPLLKDAGKAECELAAPVLANSEVIGCAVYLADDADEGEGASETASNTLEAAAALLGLLFEE